MRIKKTSVRRAKRRSLANNRLSRDRPARPLCKWPLAESLLPAPTIATPSLAECLPFDIYNMIFMKLAKMGGERNILLVCRSWNIAFREFSKLYCNKIVASRQNNHIIKFLKAPQSIIQNTTENFGSLVIINNHFNFVAKLNDKQFILNVHSHFIEYIDCDSRTWYIYSHVYPYLLSKTTVKNTDFDTLITTHFRFDGIKIVEQFFAQWIQSLTVPIVNFLTKKSSLFCMIATRSYRAHEVARISCRQNKQLAALEHKKINIQ